MESVFTGAWIWICSRSFLPSPAPLRSTPTTHVCPPQAPVVWAASLLSVDSRSLLPALCSERTHLICASFCLLKSLSLSFSLSLLSVCLSLSLCLSVSLKIYHCLSVCLSLSIYIYICLCLCLSVSVCLSLSLLGSPSLTVLIVSVDVKQQ